MPTQSQSLRKRDNSMKSQTKGLVKKTSTKGKTKGHAKKASTKGKGTTKRTAKRKSSSSSKTTKPRRQAGAAPKKKTSRAKLSGIIAGATVTGIGLLGTAGYLATRKPKQPERATPVQRRSQLQKDMEQTRTLLAEWDPQTENEQRQKRLIEEIFSGKRPWASALFLESLKSVGNAEEEKRIKKLRTVMYRVVNSSFRQIKNDCKLAGYTVGREIGSGGFGKVYQVTNTATGSQYAMKVICGQPYVEANIWAYQQTQGTNLLPELIDIFQCDKVDSDETSDLYTKRHSPKEECFHVYGVIMEKARGDLNHYILTYGESESKDGTKQLSENQFTQIKTQILDRYRQLLDRSVSQEDLGIEYKQTATQIVYMGAPPTVTWKFIDFDLLNMNASVASGTTWRKEELDNLSDALDRFPKGPPANIPTSVAKKFVSSKSQKGELRRRKLLLLQQQKRKKKVDLLRWHKLPKEKGAVDLVI